MIVVTLFGLNQIFGQEGKKRMRIKEKKETKMNESAKRQVKSYCVFTLLKRL